MLFSMFHYAVYHSEEMQSQEKIFIPLFSIFNELCDGNFALISRLKLLESINGGLYCFFPVLRCFYFKKPQLSVYSNVPEEILVMHEMCILLK